MSLPRARKLRRAAAAAVLAALAGCAGAPVSRQKIAQDEDLRVEHSRILERGARDSSPEIRGAAARAMGRIQSPSYVGALSRLIGDADLEVRREAVFALGQLFIADTGAFAPRILRAEESLAKSYDGGEKTLRPVLIDALGKADGRLALPVLLRALKDQDPEVRGRSALGIFRLKFLGRIPDYSSGTVVSLVEAMKDPDETVRWRAVYAFSRFPEPRASAGLKAAAEDAALWTRFFAVRALGQLRERTPIDVLVKAAKDLDPQVRAEAVHALGLARRGDLLNDDLFRDGSAHVRAAAAEALGETGNPKLAVSLSAFNAENSALARGAALIARAKLLGERALPSLTRDKDSFDWRLRSQVYAALGEIPSAAKLLKEGSADFDPRAAAAALESLARSTEPFVDAELARVLEDPGSPLELRGTAADAAGDRKSAALIGPLMKALKNSSGREFAEVREDIAKAVNAIAAADPGRKLRRIDPPAAKPEASLFLGKAPERAFVLLETEKGEIELELFPKDAPAHVASFLANVSSGAYSGTSWHRVVSGFVIQGGDPRGSGWGDCGYSLRDEINLWPFERGTLGMPKAGKDTGGCQIFITVVPAPHLDGRYTAFGRVTRGMDVVDRIEPGDKILRARRLP